MFIPDGKIQVNVEYKGTTTQEELYIVPEKYAAPLGRIWIRHLNIDLSNTNQGDPDSTLVRSIKSTDENDEIFSKFTDIFESKIGCIPNITVSLKLREGAKPIFYREREVSYALIDKVDQELEDLETTGMIPKSKQVIGAHHLSWFQKLIIK